MGGKGEGRSQIMQGVFLHILADTLGSAGVIVSAILMWAFGWMIADPICSIFIAILIGMSVWSMLADSVAILMQRTPKQLDHQLADCYQRVMQLKLEVLPDCDPKYIISHTQNIFRGVNVTQLYIQLDYEHHQNGGAGIQGYSASQASSWTQPSSAATWAPAVAASSVPMGYNPQSMGQNLLLQPPGGYSQYQAPSPASTASHGHSHSGDYGHSHGGDHHGHSHQGKQW